MLWVHFVIVSRDEEVTLTVRVPVFSHWKCVTELGEDAWLCSLCYLGTPSPMEVTQVLCSSHGSVQKHCVQAVDPEGVLRTLKERRVIVLLMLGQYLQGFRRLMFSHTPRCGFLRTLIKHQSTVPHCSLFLAPHLLHRNWGRQSWVWILLVILVRALWSGLVVLSQSVILRRRFVQDRQSQK